MATLSVMSDPKAVSHMCATGKHLRCLGTVYVYPPVKGEDGELRRIVECECPTPDCGHGTEVEKAKHTKAAARRRRNS